MVLPPDQPAAALSHALPWEALAPRQKSGKARGGEMCDALSVDSLSPCKSAGDCARGGSMQFELIWAMLGGDGRGRDCWCCQATLPVY